MYQTNSNLSTPCLTCLDNARVWLQAAGARVDQGRGMTAGVEKQVDAYNKINRLLSAFIDRVRSP